MISGDALRDEGMERVLLGTPPSWFRAYDRIAAEWFDAMPPGTVFAGEAAHRRAVEQGLGEPHHANVWSSAFASYLSALRKARLIEEVGLTQMTRPSAHARANRAYRKL